MTDIAPGWYRDPVDPDIQRYWDGEAYVGDPIPADATPPSGPPVIVMTTAVAPKPPAPPRSDPTASAQPAHPTASAQPVSPAVTPQPAASDRPAVALDAATPVPGRPGSAQLPGPVAQQNWPPYPRLVLPPPRPHGLPLAGFGARFVARIIDTLAVLGLNVLVNGYFVYQFIKAFRPFNDALQQQGGSLQGLQPPPELSNLIWIILLVAAALWFAYEVPQIANTGQTIGKRLLGIRVMQLDSEEPVGFRRSIRRWNTLGLPTLLWPCGLGFVLQSLDCLWLVIDQPLRQALHDKSASTVVVTVGAAGSRGHDSEQADSTGS